LRNSGQQAIHKQGQDVSPCTVVLARDRCTHNTLAIQYQSLVTVPQCIAVLLLCLLCLLCPPWLLLAARCVSRSQGSPAPAP
jgi:hypothetical protein